MKIIFTLFLAAMIVFLNIQLLPHINTEYDVGIYILTAVCIYFGYSVKDVVDQVKKGS